VSTSVIHARSPDSVTADSTVRLTIPARPEYIALCRLALAGLSRTADLDDEVVADLKLALTEACSNSVRHAYPGGQGTVEVVYRVLPDRLVIEVADDGAGFALADLDLNEGGDLSEGGLGMAIMRAIADELEVEPRENGRGSRLRLVKRLGA
jgi:serine/threonine-protein kinase RsbW